MTDCLHIKCFSVTMIWLFSFIAAVYVFSYHFMDVYIVPKWLSFGVLYAILFSLCSIYHLTRSNIDDIRIYVYASIATISFIEAFRGIYGHVLYHSEIKGFFDNVAGYASMQCIGISFILNFCQAKYHSAIRVLAWVAIAIVICSIVLSQSRAGVLVSFTITMIFVITISAPQIRRLLILCSGIVLLAILLICFTIKNDSTEGREFILGRSWEMIKDKPLLGFGFGGFKQCYMDYQADLFSSNNDAKYSMLADNIKHPLNEYVKIIIEYGIVGLLCITLGILLLYRSINKKYRVIDFSTLLSLLSIALLGLFSYPLQYPHTWLILTLPVFLAYTKSSDTCRAYHYSLLVASILVISSLSFQIYKELKWGYIYHNHQNIERKELLFQYGKLYSYFKPNPYFLYNYAHILYQNQEYNHALLVANECNEHWHDYDLEILRGDIYDAIGDKDYAIYTFINASHMCPNRFLPLHKLFRMALKQQDFDLARFYAKAILSKPVKVDSAEVQFIIDECYNYYHYNKL